VAGTRKLSIEILGNAKGALGALDSVGSKAGAIGGKLVDFGKKAALGFAALGAGAIVIGKQLVDSASDLAEVTAKNDVIFGEASESVKKFAESAAKNLGQSQTAALNAASTFGVFGKAAGLTGPELSSFSTDLVTLASDMASFANTSPEEAAEALGAALRGESEPIRKYGVMLDDAALKAEALAMGIYSGKGPLTTQQKVLAAQAAIFKQTSDAQGDFARTSDGVANQQRIMAAQFENVKAKLGQALIPAFASALGFITNKVFPAFESIGTVFEKEGLSGVIDKIKEKLPAVKKALSGYASAAFEWIKDAYPPALKALLDFVYDIGQFLLKTGLPFIAEKLGEGASALFDWIGKAAPPALQRAGELIGDLANWFIDEGLPMLVEKLIELGDALVEWIEPNIGPALEALGEFLLDVLNWFVNDAIPKISEQAVKLGEAFLEWTADILPESLKALNDFIEDLVKALPGLFFKLANEFEKLGKDLVAKFSLAIVEGLQSFASGTGKLFANGVIDFLNKLINDLNRSLELKISLPFGKSFTIDPPDIPPLKKYATGGIINSPTLALMGEAGPEAVIPLNRLNSMGYGGGTGNTITINVQGADPQAVVKALQQYNRTAGPIPVNTRAN
tara:strand:+ start:7580 stop:9448 length:1869 start_codon:yes stop_codon:yes gene_type:complete